MPAPKIFFSYARNNSDFVIDLAKKLKQDGYNVWLDQLDIAPGARWDQEIQKALTDANTMIIVLTKESVNSENVLDEVSFAIDEGKKIVPVLYEDCDIPFRLRRFQYIDFTKSKPLALNKLEATLKGTDKVESNEEPVEAKEFKSADLKVEPPKTVTPAVKHKVEPVNPSPVKNAKMGRNILYALLPLLLIASYFIYQSKGNNEKKANQGIENTENGQPKEQSNETPLVDESEFWIETLETKTKAGYQDYITSFPNGKYADAAKASIEDIDLWQQAISSESLQSVLEYQISHKGEGLYSSEIKNKIAEFQSHSGWLYAGRANGEEIGRDRIFDVICCDVTSISSIPKPGDILKNISSGRRIYPTSGDTQSGNSNLPLIPTDKIAFVDEVQQNGSAVVLKVSYEK